MFEKVTWLGSDGSSLKLRETFGQQPARKQEHQSYNLKEVNSANNMHELRMDPDLQMRTQPSRHPDFSLMRP